MEGEFVKIAPSDAEEGEFILVSKLIANKSVTIANMIGEIPDSDEAIPLINVTENMLRLVLDFLEYHEDNWVVFEKGDSTDIDEWDKEFFDMSQKDLFELILAANFLDIKPLLDLSCKTVANMIKGKTPEEIRKTFNIKNDFTPEEEAKIRRENEWCEER